MYSLHYHHLVFYQMKFVYTENLYYCRYGRRSIKYYSHSLVSFFGLRVKHTTIKLLILWKSSFVGIYVRIWIGIRSDVVVAFRKGLTQSSTIPTIPKNLWYDSVVNYYPMCRFLFSIHWSLWQHLPESVFPSQLPSFIKYSENIFDTNFSLIIQLSSLEQEPTFPSHC